MAKKKRKFTHKPTDATLRNVRAGASRDRSFSLQLSALKKRVAALELAVGIEK